MLVSFCMIYNIPNICNRCKVSSNFVPKYTWKSIVTIFIQILNIFINCIVILMGFNNDNHNSYYNFIYCHLLLFICLIITYLSIKASESIICIIFKWAEQYFNNLNDNLDRSKPERKNMHCVSINCILRGIMMVICIMYLVYPLINCLVFQQMISSYTLMQIICIVIVCTRILYPYYNQTMAIYSLITYCIVFIIVVFDLRYLIHVYQWLLVSHIVISYLSSINININLVL